MHLNQCINCNEKCKNSENLMEHMKSENHLQPPSERDEWDQSQYYFPTYENDNFLCLIQDDDTINKTEEEAPVIPQELPVQESILFEDECRKQLLPKK